MNGILNLYKPEQMSSFLAVRICRGIFGVKKAGHAGTLDPLATGVLPILIGNACGAANYFLAEKKTYRATFQIGFCTDTEDITGSILETSAVFPGESEWQEALCAFRGESLQVPPMYSALKKDGRPLYELARRGVQVTREARPIFVEELELFPTPQRDRFVLTATVSKGTYIRTLICDIARRAGTLATMTSLCRTRHGEFDLSEAVSLEELKRKKEAGENLASLLLPVERAFGGYREVCLPAFYARLARHGAEIYTKRARVGGELCVGERVRMTDEQQNFFALGEVREFEEGRAIKPLKLFL